MYTRVNKISLNEYITFEIFIRFNVREFNRPIKEIESSLMRDNRQIDMYIHTYVHKSKGNNSFGYFAVTVVDKMEIYS